MDRVQPPTFRLVPRPSYSDTYHYGTHVLQFSLYPHFKFKNLEIITWKIILGHDVRQSLAELWKSVLLLHRLVLYLFIKPLEKFIRKILQNDPNYLEKRYMTQLELFQFVSTDMSRVTKSVTTFFNFAINVHIFFTVRVLLTLYLKLVSEYE